MEKQVLQDKTQYFHHLLLLVVVEVVVLPIMETKELMLVLMEMV